MLHLSRFVVARRPLSTASSITAPAGFLASTDDKGVASVTFNRPDIHNAFDDRLIDDLTAHLDTLAKDTSVKALLLKANGKSFSAGADLNWMGKMAAYTREQNHVDATNLGNLMHKLYKFPRPTIALVQGAAYGGGVGLVSCCDMAVATKSASFCLSEVKLGLIPAVISPYVLNAIGERACRRYFLTAEVFGAVEAHRLGLIHTLVETPDELVAEGNRLTGVLLENGTQALAAAKRLVEVVARTELNDALRESTVDMIANIRVGAEAQGRINAFLKKASAPRKAK